MLRRNCFWFDPWQDMAATIPHCYLEYDDLASCPCSNECEWFISEADVRSIIYNKLLQEKEHRDAQMPFGF